MSRSLFTPADGTTIPAVASLFIPELDGDTFESLADLADYFDAKAEIDAETAYERHLETNDQYAWEVEQDERRAAFFGGY